MTKKKLTDAEKLVNNLTPYVDQPESGTTEFIIYHILQYLIDNFYEYFPQLEDEDEFYGKLYGSHGKIEVERLENMITQLQTMEVIKKQQFEEKKLSKIPTDKQLDDLWDEIGGYYNLYDEVRDTIREALNRWRTQEPIALEEREPQPSDLDEENCCWWWDDTDGVWERMRGDDRGVVSIRKINQKIDCPHYYTHWLPFWVFKEPHPN